MSTKEMIQIMAIPADESRPVEIRTIDSGLESMQAEVGGNIECLATEAFDLWLNEEGRITGLPTNHRAIRLTAAIGPVGGYGYLHHLLGDVFITGGVDDDTGETLSLDDQTLIDTLWAALGTAPQA